MLVEQWKLRRAFAANLSTMYGREVPAYTTLVEVAREVNRDVAARDGRDACRLGSLDRVTAERHGAIRVGTPNELRVVATIFAGFGMHPVGFYDLRDTATRPVPVVSTAFRPTDAKELDRNPFRVFTSMLTVGDERFFDAGLRSRLTRFLDARELFPPGIVELARRAEADGGLTDDDAHAFIELAVRTFELSTEPVDRSWYAELERISSVAADIGGVSTTHINHMTPRVLDIDDLQHRMTARGITMIDAIQGPPRWDGPQVLLRQTSFRALAEPRVLREPDGSLSQGSLRVRFGEVEARGIALTPAGRSAYDALMHDCDLGSSAEPDAAASIALDLWSSRFPGTEQQLRDSQFAYFRYRPGSAPTGPIRPTTDLDELVRNGSVVVEPIVYEDFLPRSAAGIFQSNLDSDGSRTQGTTSTRYDSEWMSGAIDRQVQDPYALYAREQQTSIKRTADQLGLAHPADRLIRHTAATRQTMKPTQETP